MRKTRFAFLQKMTALLCLSALLMTCLPALATDLASAPLSSVSAAKNGMVRVYLSSLGSPTRLSLTTAGSYSINGNVNQALSSGETVSVSINTSTGNLTLTRGGSTLSMGQSFALRRHSTAGANGITIAQARRPANPYPGDISFTAVRQSSGSYKLYTIAHIYIENYLYGVLPYEMGNSANIEALKSQAVSARTYTLRMMNARASGRYDVVDTTSDQVYNGTPTGNDNCVKAVDSTKGIVLMNGSSLTSTYYSASNGGQTESAQHVWGGSGYGYLALKDDTFDYNNPDSRVVSKTVYADATSASQNASLMNLLKSKAVSALKNAGYAATTANTALQTVTAVVPHTPKYDSPSKLYTKVDFTLAARTVSASGGTVTATVTVTCGIFTELESLLGMSIQSSQNELWSVKKSGGNFILQARRYGHGVGLSQRGAMYMGKLGYTYDQILAFYYTGCKRVRYAFSHTILSAVSSGSSTTETTVEEAAELEENADGAATAVVKLVSSGDVLAIRGSKSQSGAMVGTVPNSAPVKVLASDGTWAFIQYGGLKGYVPVNALVISGTPPAETTEAPTVITGYATVKANGYLNLRQSGSYSATVVTQAPSGAVLTVFGQSGGWANVQYGSIVAYASTDFLVMSATYPSQVADSGSVSATVQSADGQAVNLRATPSTGGAVLSALPVGTVVTVTASDGSWCTVVYGGQTGYMMSDYLLLGGSVVDTPATTPPAPSLGEGEVAAIANPTASTLNLRAEASETATILTEIPRGQSVVVTQKGETWCAVRYEGVSGYAMTQYLTFAGSSGNTGGSAEMATVATQSGSLNLRSEAMAGSTILARIPKGASVVVTSRGATWSAVMYSGVSGYVMTEFLAFDGGADTPATDAPTISGGTAVVTTASGSLNLRAEGKAGSTILRTIPRQAVVTVLSRGTDWSQVSYEGTTGYVMSVFLTFQSADATPTPTPTTEPSASPEATATPAPSDGAPSASPDASETPADTALPTDTPAPTDTPVPTDTPAPDDGTLRASVNTVSGSLNLRLEARTGSAVLARIPKGTVLVVEEKLAAWSRVTYAGATGYVMNSFLRFLEEGAGTGTSEIGVAWVNTVSGSLNLRQEAASGARILARIPQGAQVSVHQQGASWSHISYAGTTGYAMSSFLRFGESAATPTPVPSATPQASALPDASAPPTADSGLRTGWVLTPSGSLNLRQTPATNAAILTEIPQYAAVTVTGEGGEWCAVTYGALSGYVQAQYLTFTQPSQQPAVNTSASAWVLTPSGSLNLRQTDSSSAKILLEIPRLAQLALLSRGESWCQVTYQGTTGYVMTKYLTFTQPSGASATVSATPATISAVPAAASATSAPTPAPAMDPTLQVPTALLTALVNTPDSKLSVYAECAPTATLVTEIAHGERMVVLRRGESWCEIEYDDLAGYCLTSLLTMEVEP